MNITKTYYKLILAVVALAITAYYFFINPSTTTFGFQCLFYKTTGLYCPGCGGQRAFHHLLHGNFASAFHDNLLIFMILPLVGVRFYEEIYEIKIMPKFLFSTKFLIALVLFLVIFTIFRNLPLKFFT